MSYDFKENFWISLSHRHGIDYYQCDLCTQVAWWIQLDNFCYLDYDYEFILQYCKELLLKFRTVFEKRNIRVLQYVIIINNFYRESLFDKI